MSLFQRPKYNLKQGPNSYFLQTKFNEDSWNQLKNVLSRQWISIFRYYDFDFDISDPQKSCKH